MTTIERLSSALGRPKALREMADGSRFLGAIGRWRHQGAKIDLSDADTVQVVFNVSGGQRVEVRSRAGAVRRIIRAGSIGIVSPDSVTQVAVTGSADTVQIILNQGLLTSPAASLPLRSGTRAARLRAAAVQALVELARDESSSDDPLEAILRRVAVCLAVPVAWPEPRPCKGGLSPSARRRVGALLDERLQTSGCSPLSLAELANAADLSVHHFIKAFRRTEGVTPRAMVMGRRLDVAVNLLLQPQARVDWIAMQTGFSSPAHFVSTFRQHMGATPGALRDAVGRR